MNDRPDNKVYNVLFLCTGNSARSIIAEAILNRVGQGRFQAFSAGSHPRGRVHPATVDLLQQLNFDVSGLRSKSWTEFAASHAPSSILCLQFATTRRVKRVRCGLASR